MSPGVYLGNLSAGVKDPWTVATMTEMEIKAEPPLTGSLSPRMF